MRLKSMIIKRTGNRAQGDGGGGTMCRHVPKKSTASQRKGPTPASISTQLQRTGAVHACIHSTSQSQLDVLGPKEATLERKELDKDTVVTQGTISPMKAGAALLCTLTISCDLSQGRGRWQRSLAREARSLECQAKGFYSMEQTRERLRGF